MIRRASGNFDPEEIAEFLLQQQELWVAAILYCVSTLPHRATPLIQVPVLYHLTELPEDYWYADTLYVLTPDLAAAKKLVELGKEAIGGMTTIFSEAQVNLMLPILRNKNHRIVWFWWD
jgi:hypothetical protein